MSTEIGGKTASLYDRLLPNLTEVEVKRKELEAKYKTRRPLAFAGWALTVAVVGGLLFAMPLPPALFIGIVLAGGIWYWLGEPARDYRSQYKWNLLPHVAREFGNFEYSQKGGIKIERMKPSGLIPVHDRYGHEDHFTGVHDGVGIEFCEAKLAIQRGSGKNRQYRLLFQGLFVILEMNRPFSSHTILRRDGKGFGWFSKFKNLERVRLEDPEFERQFEVYGNDQVEARVLLTPALMERLKGLEQSVGAKHFECAFYQNSLLIMMAHAGAMEPGGLLEPGPLSQSAEDRDALQRIAQEFEQICGIVSELKLNERRHAAEQTAAPAGV